MQLQSFIPVADHVTHSHGPMQELIETFYCWIFHLEEGSSLSEFLSHFTYDLIRTFLVFFVVLIIVSFLKTYISAQSVRYTLLHVNRFGAIFLAAVAGLFSSTCVCTNVPLFFGFLAFGVPLHLGMVFLLSSSLINIASLISMAALTDWRFTLAFVIASIFIAVITGFILSFLHGEKYIKAEIETSSIEVNKNLKFSDRLACALHETMHTFKHQWLWILLGVALSALIISVVDLDFASKISSLGFLGVFLAAVIGLVLHTDIISIVPVLSTLIDLHVSFGILFSLAASLAFFSIPMMLMVKNTIRLRYLLYTWGIVFVLILIAGTAMLGISV